MSSKVDIFSGSKNFGQRCRQRNDYSQTEEASGQNDSAAKQSVPVQIIPEKLQSGGHEIRRTGGSFVGAETETTFVGFSSRMGRYVC